MSALPAFTGLTQEGRSRSRSGCWGWGGGWSANHPEPRQAAHSQIRPPPPAHALPFKAAGLRGHREAQRTRRSSATLPRRLTPGVQPPQPAREAATASQKGSRLGLPPLPRGGTMARLAAPWHSALLVRIFGSTWWLLFVAGQVGRSARLAFLPLLAFFLVCAPAESALSREGLSGGCAATRAGTGGAGLG